MSILGIRGLCTHLMQRFLNIVSAMPASFALRAGVPSLMWFNTNKCLTGEFVVLELYPYYVMLGVKIVLFPFAVHDYFLRFPSLLIHMGIYPCLSSQRLKLLGCLDFRVLFHVFP